MQGNAKQKDESKPGLTRKQEGGIAALLIQPTMKEAATAAGVNEATLWRWLQSREFHAAYMKARRDSVKQALARLQQTTTEAVTVLRDIMIDTDAPCSVRVTAAKAIIDYSIKAVEVEDLEQRVFELEQLITQKPVGR